MDDRVSVGAGPGQPTPPSVEPPDSVLRRTWRGIRARIFSGLLLVLPILITFWAVYWLYSSLERYLIDPLALMLLWKIRGHENDTQLPAWFESYVATVIAIIIALLLLYLLGFFVRSRLQRGIDWVLLRLPFVSVVYSGVRNVFQALDNQRGQQRRPQRVVMISQPGSGLKMAGFVTGTSRDEATGKSILCVYVPTAPVPTNGFLFLVPEEEVTNLNWTPEQTLQTIISGGFTAPPEIGYSPGAVPK